MTQTPTAGFSKTPFVVLGLTIAAAVVLLLTSKSSTHVHDPCFGIGTFVSSRTAPGTNERYNDCQVSPASRVTVDDATGRVLSATLTLDNAIAYYQQHPDERPGVKGRRELLEGMFTTPDVADLQPLLVPGCAADWVRKAIPDQGVQVCFPADWQIDTSVPHRVLLMNGSETLVNVSSPDPEITLKCEQPVAVDTPIGSVDVCAAKPQFGGQSHHLLLPNGILVFVWVADGAPADLRAAAFRAAMSVERTP